MRVHVALMHVGRKAARWEGSQGGETEAIGVTPSIMIPKRKDWPGGNVKLQRDKM